MRYVLIYGAIAGSITIAVIASTFVFDLPDHLHSEWFGYLVMLVALSLIFVGVKRYRDVECGGIVKFWRALAVGLGIAVVAGLFYVAGWEGYLATTDGNFIETYANSMLADMRASGASEAEIAATQAEMAPYIDAYAHPLSRMAITFVEIFPVGVLIALISAAALCFPSVLPARVTAGARSPDESTGSGDLRAQGDVRGV